jgi:hypothetical protein
LIRTGYLADVQGKVIRELNHRVTWRKVLRFAAAVILSMFWAYVTEVFIGQYSTTLTFAMPGQYIADRVVPLRPPPNQLSTPGETLLLAFAVDSARYLVLILGLSATCQRRCKNPHSAG